MEVPTVEPNVHPGQIHRILERVRNEGPSEHSHLRTELPYVDWIKPFILFRGKRHPSDLDDYEL